MQINLPALPLPRLHSLFAFEHARGFAALLGPVLLGQWLLPWGGGLWSWNLGAGTWWGLLAGVVLTALAFAPIPDLKRGHVFLATAVLGVMGLGWTGAILGAGFFFFLSSLGLYGLATVLTALILWSRNGHRPFYEKLLLVGLGALGLGLILPMGFGVPLARIFSHLGDDAPNILARLLFTLLSLGALGLIALVVLNVLLKKDTADRAQVERLAVALSYLPVAALFIYGFFSFFSVFGIAMHLLITIGASLFLSVHAAVVTIERADAGESFQALIARS